VFLEYEVFCLANHNFTFYELVRSGWFKNSGFYELMVFKKRIALMEK